MHAADILLLLAALLGHATLWIEFVNHVHATGMPRWTKFGLTKFGYGVLLLAPAGVAWWMLRGGATSSIVSDPWNTPVPLLYYLAVCCTAAVVIVPVWCRHRFFKPADAILFRQHAVGSRLDAQLGIRHGGGAINRLLLSLPGNQSYDLVTSEKELVVPRMDAALDGVVIAHLSDLHFTGRIDKAFFQEIVRRTNRLTADLVVITGDLVDRDACIDWIPDTLAALESRWGTFFILGNHDTRVNLPRLRQALQDAQLIDLGGRSTVLNVRNRRLLLAGNELPWIGPAAEVKAPADAADSHVAARLLLAHTPDQYSWARLRGFDLMLAGHTHGGQIVFPLIGPLVIPSRYGAKYAAGVFYEPPTVLHVSRGLSAEHPIRINCPPELVRLVLRSPQCVESCEEAGLRRCDASLGGVRPLAAGTEIS